MKKRRIIVLLSACLVIGSVSVYAASPNPNIETMQNVGQLFKSFKTIQMIRSLQKESLVELLLKKILNKLLNFIF